MSEPRVVVRKDESKRSPVRPWGEGATFRVAGWVGFVFVLAALGDFALAFYPLGLGSPEWEVATIASVLQGFPLLSLGLVGLWMCGGGLGDRRLLVTVGIGFLAIAVAVLLALVLLLTDVPIALKATQGAEAARIGILKLVVRTLSLGVLFGSLYAVAGVQALKQARGGSRG